MVPILLNNNFMVALFIVQINYILTTPPGKSDFFAIHLYVFFFLKNEMQASEKNARQRFPCEIKSVCKKDGNFFN